MMDTRTPARIAQSGAVLLVSLILLVVLTMFAIAVMNYTNIQSRIAGNLQVRNELKAANQQAIEQVISGDFTVNPLSVDILSDVNGDGTNDYKVTVAHTCISAQTIAPDDVRIDPVPVIVAGVPVLSKYQGCSMSGGMSNAGVAGAMGGGSYCSDSVWDIEATGTDATTATFKTAASVTTHQGIGIVTVVGSGC